MLKNKYKIKNEKYVEGSISIPLGGGVYSSVRKFYWNEGQDNWNKTYTKLGGGEYSSVSIGRKELRSKEH